MAKIESFEISEPQATAAANWWAENWIPDGTRDAFRDGLRELLLDPAAITDRERFSDGSVRLVVDYDPHGLMLVAVRKVVPGCLGFMYSARGLLYGKTKMRIHRDRIEVSGGRGVPWEEIWRSEPVQAYRDGAEIDSHINAEPHARVMDWLKTASAADIMRASIAVGIYDPAGDLTEAYRDPPPDPPAIRLGAEESADVADLLERPAGAVPALTGAMRSALAAPAPALCVLCAEPLRDGDHCWHEHCVTTD